MSKPTSLAGLAMATGIFLAVNLTVSAFAWLRLPPDAAIPIHWNAAGEVDGYGSKSVALLLLPAATVLMVALVVGLTRLDPRRAHVDASRKFLTVVLVGFMILSTGIHAGIALAGLGYGVPMDRIAGTLAGLLFIVIGNFMGKVRSNYVMGLRTPWTLSSELSWNKSNRLGGKLFVLAGALSVLAALTVGGIAAAGTLIASVLSAALIAVVYSYIVWKSDPAAH